MTGLEFSGYRPGLDAAVDVGTTTGVDRDGKHYTVFTGVGDTIFNSVTNWSLEKNSLTLTMHCTSDLDRATKVQK